MMSKLEGLPCELARAILAHLSTIDALALILTCKTLYACVTPNERKELRDYDKCAVCWKPVLETYCIVCSAFAWCSDACEERDIGQHSPTCHAHVEHLMEQLRQKFGVLPNPGPWH